MNSKSLYIKNQAILTPKNKKLALKLVIETDQILTNGDEVCIPSLFSTFLAVAVKLFVATGFEIDTPKLLLVSFALPNYKL